MTGRKDEHCRPQMLRSRKTAQRRLTIDICKTFEREILFSCVDVRGEGARKYVAVGRTLTLY